MQVGKSRVALTTILNAVAVAVTIATAAPVQAAGTHPVTGEALSDDQTFTYRLLDQFPTLDPQLNEDTSGFHVIRDLFEGLLSQDANGDLVPGVAAHYTASDGNTTYTFTLREDARWSNGDPVTAHDFVHAWRRAVDPATASPYGWYLKLTEMVNAGDILAGNKPPSELGARAVDDYTLEVKLNTALPYFPAMTTYATLFPAHRATIEAHGANDGKYSNPKVDELMRASKTAEDPPAIYSEVEQILAEDMAIVPIYHYANTFLLSADIRGWPYDNVENNWYSKNLYRVAD